MVAQNTNRVSDRLPVVTLAVVAAAIAILLLPDLATRLVYDRTAILNGQLWRLFTGHWVHFSPKHFVYDVGVFGIVGWLIEVRGCKNYGWLCVLSSWLIGFSLLAFDPHLAVCGGLSGIATAAVVFLALDGLRKNNAWSRACKLLLLATAAKIVFELLTGGLVFLRLADDSILSVPISHLTGALTAVGVWAWNEIQAHIKRAPGWKRFFI